MELDIVKEKLGLSLRGLAKALGGTYTMCVYWKRVGYIPARRHQEIRDLASRMGVSL